MFCVTVCRLEITPACRDLRCSSGTSTCGGGAGCGFPTYGSCSLDITYRRSSESSANYPNTLGDPQQAGAGHGLPELGNDTALPPLGLPSYDLLGSSFRTGDLFCTDMDFPVQDAVLQDAALQDVELMPASSGLVDAIPPLPVAAPWQQEGMTSQPSDAAQAIAAVRETGELPIPSRIPDAQVICIHDDCIATTNLIWFWPVAQ